MPKDKVVLERKVVSYPKEFDKKGKLKENQNQMMERALENAIEEGYSKISVQTEDEKDWTVLFYN